MKTILSLLVLALAIPASAGVFSGVKETVKGAAHDGFVAAKVATFPARHPKKTAHATGKAVKSTGKAVTKL